MPVNPVPATTSASDTFDISAEIERLKVMAAGVPMPDGLKDKIAKMLMRLTRMAQLGSYSQEYESVEQYIRWAVQIPWGKYGKDNLDLVNAKQNLDEYHFGLEQVKDIVLEYLAVMKLQIEGMPEAVPAAKAAAVPAASGNPSAAVLPPASPVVAPPAAVQPAVEATAPVPAVPVVAASAAAATAPSVEMSRLQGSSSHAPILCFVGIQGVGKTSIAKSIANALTRPFIRISLGALGNVTQIRGVNRTEQAAEPGQIIKAVIRSGVMNPLILLDEIDKTSSETGLRADLMAALLEILDPEQNSTFVDHYIDYPVDLSAVIFITTANNLGGISAALLDRLEIVRFSSYTDDDKIQIAKNYMLPKVREAVGITPQQLSFDDDVWPLVVRPLGFDAGVRQLERTLTTLARKVARRIIEGKGNSFKITKDNFREFIPEDIGVYS